jgi:hypothetical protein
MKKLLFNSNKTWYIFYFGLVFITLLIEILAKNKIINLLNIFIPDSKTYEIRSLEKIEFESLFYNSYTIFNSIIYNISSFWFLPINIFLTLISIKLCDYAFSNISLESVNFAKFYIIFNPYLLIGLIGPNKETILIFCCLLFIAAFLYFKGHFRNIFFLFSIILPFFIRPVISMVMIFTLMTIPLIKYKLNASKIFILVICLFLITNSIPYFNTLYLSLTDNDENLLGFQASKLYEISLILKILNSDPVLQIFAFVTKFLLLLFLATFRTIHLFSWPWPFLDLGYNYLALISLPIHIGLFFLLLRKYKTKVNNFQIEFCLVFYCFGLISTAINPIVTYRYLFPYTPILFALFPLLNIKPKKFIKIISLFIIFGVIFINMYNKIQYVDDDYSLDLPEYLKFY